MTRIPLSRSKVKVTRPLYTLGSCSGDRGNVFTVGTYCYVAVRCGRLGGARHFSAHRGRRGAGAYCGGSARLVIRSVCGEVCLMLM